MLFELRANVFSADLRVRRFCRRPTARVGHSFGRRPIAAIAISVLSGCAAAYQAIIGPLAVPLSFSNETSKPMSVHLYGGSDECTSRRPLGLLAPTEI